MLTEKRQLAIVFLVMALFLFTSCNKGTNKQKDLPHSGLEEQVMITETARSMQNAPLYVALEKGFFQQVGLPVKLETQSDLAEAVKNLNSGKSHFFIGTADKILYLYQQGQKNFSLIGQVSTSTGYLLLARKSGPFAWQNLKGKVILGYRGGDLPLTLLYAQLRNNGLRPYLTYHPVENLAYEVIPTIYRAGSGDFLLAEEPLVSSLEAEGAAVIITAFKLTPGKLPAHTVMASKEFLQGNKAIGRNFLLALQLSNAWLEQASPAEIAETLQTYFPEYPEIVLQRAAGRYKNTACWGELQIDETAYQQLQELLLEEKELRQQIPADQLLDYSLFGSS